MRLRINYILIILHSGLFINAQKFAPKGDSCLVFIGQDLASVGGLTDFNDGYCDFFEVPAGVTAYTNLSPGDNSFGLTLEGLDGLRSNANWGAGPSNASRYLTDSSFSNTAIAIGLSFVNHERQLSKGKLDDLIVALGDWIKSTNRPVFLRVGYEFDGWNWNHYNQKHYLKAWNRIHAILKRDSVENVAFIWQSKGNGTSYETLEKWYPGDHLVDWCGYSYFSGTDDVMINFARNHNKPVFIAEATPVRATEALHFNSDLKIEGLDSILWEQWFVPFFETLENNKDVIKGFSYINCDWNSQPMWSINPVFSQVDSRIQMSKLITENWIKILDKPRYLKAKNVKWRL